MGIMDNLGTAFSQPDMYKWLGNVGAGLSRAGRGQGFDISQANQQLFQGMADRKAQERLGGLMDQFGLNPQQRGLLDQMPLQAQQQILAGQAFPQGGKSTPEIRNLEWIKQNHPQEYDEAVRRIMMGGEQSDRETMKDIAGRQRYADTGELVFPNVEDPAPELNVKDEGALRKEWTALTSDFRKVNASYNRIQASADSASPAGDLALIFNYMKMLDPGSVVRESEFRVAANAAPLLERYGIEGVAKVWAGQRLTPDQRADFVSRATSLYERANETFSGQRDQYRDIAGQYGFDPERVIPDMPDTTRPQETTGGYSAGARARNPATGEIIEWNGSAWVPVS